MADVLSISSSAIGVYQRVLGVVSNNIANVGNEGYVKQDATISQTPPTFDGRNFLGTGSLFQGVERQYNAFIETSLRNATANLAGQQALVNYANRAVDVLGSPEIGLAPALDRFFSAARGLAADPASPVARTTFLRETEGVASRFRELASQMQQLEAETQQALNSDVGEVNALASQLGKVNLELSRNRSLDRQAPALLDERDQLLRALSDHLDIQVSEAANGVVQVSVGGAGSSGALVAGQVVKPLQVTLDPQAPERMSVLLDPYGSQPVSIAGIAGGSFGGIASFRGQVLETALSNLDLLAKTFMTEVNRVQTEGVDGYGDTGRALLGLQTQFSFERVRGTALLNMEAQVRDLQEFDGKDIRLAFDAEAGQVYSTSLLGPFASGDRFEVTLNGLSKSFTIGGDTSPDGVAQQLRQFIDGSFGVQLRSQVDPNGQVLVNSSVMKSFAFDVKISSAEGRAQIGQSQGLWVATNRSGERVTGVNSLVVDGVAINVLGQPANGEQLIVHASSRPAASLISLLGDPSRVAGAMAFRAVRGLDNISSVKATITDRIGEPAAPPAAPVLGSASGLANNPVPSEAQAWVAQRVVPFATVAAGQKDVALYLDPGVSQANLQILTRDGRHLLGTNQADGASFVSNITSLPAPFEPGSTYSAQYLNKTGGEAYKDLSLFYGARAKPTTVEVMGTDHVPTSVVQRPARLEAELAITSGSLLIPSDSLVLNGVALPAKSGLVSGPADVAALLNAAITDAFSAGTDKDKTALQGITAAVREGRLEITRDPSFGAAGQKGLIALSFGTNGGPQLLARMGFRTAAHLDGTVPEDLMVFTTGSGDVKISASFSGQPMSSAAQREALRHTPLEFRFITHNRFQVWDSNSQTILADRPYAPDTTITYRGLELGFSAAPQAGDVFRVDGNQDGLGDNGNALRFVDLETLGVTGPGNDLSISQAYLSVVDQIANVNQQAQVSTKALEVVRQQAVEARESVSGVSLDEEAANLIRFQQAYQAAAKSMQIASQMFDAVLRI